MAITVREEQDASGYFTAQTFTTGAGMLATDKLVVIHCNDDYVDTNLMTPTGTAGAAWVLQQTTGAGGSGASHTKVWTSDVASPGAQTVIVNNSNTDEERYAAMFVLTGAISGVDGVAGTTNSGSFETAHIAPSVTPISGQADDLLICVFMSSSGGGTGDVNYTMPGGMTAYTEQDITPWITFRCASQLLSSSAATGTRTATSSVAKTYQTTSVLIAAPGTATQPTPTVPRSRLTRASCW